MSKSSTVHFDANIAQEICSYLSRTQCIRMQLINSYFYQGALQHLSSYEEFRMTRWLKFRIETAGKNRNLALSTLALDSSLPQGTTPLNRTRINLSTYPNEKEILSRDKAPKTLILKQLRNLLSTIFVNAKRVHFSDMHITKDFLNNLMYDKRTIREKKDDRITIRMSDLSVFEIVEHVSFVGCSFETKCLNFISSKCTNLKSVLFQSCTMTLSDIEGMFSGRSKSKSIRLVFHDLFRYVQYYNEDQLTEEDLDLIKKMGLNHEDNLNKLKLYPGAIYEISIPDHVSLIPLMVDTYDESLPTRNLIENYFKLNGILSNSANVEYLLEKALSRNEDDLLENIEMILENGGHLFDIPFRVYRFFYCAINNHYSNTQLWDLFEKYNFYKFPKFTSNTVMTIPKAYSKVYNDLIIDCLNYEVEENYNLGSFFVDVYEKNFKKDFTDCIHKILDTHPSLIKNLAERGLFNASYLSEKYPNPFIREEEQNTKLLEAFDAIENIVKNCSTNDKRKREQSTSFKKSKRINR